MSATWSSKLPALAAATPAALRAGLRGGAQVAVNETRVALRKGYTSGKYVTGATVNAVTMGTPYESAGGAWAIKYGTNLRYNLWWEVGHRARTRVFFNEKTRRWFSRPGPTVYRRREIWLPVLLASQEKIREAFARVVAAALAAGVGGAP